MLGPSVSPPTACDCSALSSVPGVVGWGVASRPWGSRSLGGCTMLAIAELCGPRLFASATCCATAPMAQAVGKADEKGVGLAVGCWLLLALAFWRVFTGVAGGGPCDSEFLATESPSAAESIPEPAPVSG